MNSRLEKPLEYWIGRSTDPYLDRKDRLKCLEILATKINSEAEAASICIDLLAHKVVSPDQDEALTSIHTVDYLMRNCGEKVHSRVGKYRFLNQLVKLLTPKYLGSQTSKEVKTLVIRLMYTWQKTIKHIPKFHEVYQTLKTNGLILENPKIPEEEIAVVSPPASRCAVFEDEEKSRLLKNLLASNNPQDLQMANRLIKSLVQSEETKMAKVHERRKNLDSALFLCKAIEQMKMDRTAQSLGLGTYYPDFEEKFQRAFEELGNLQTIIYNYANELAEANDPCLEEVLSINDHINKLLPENQDDLKRNRTSKKEKPLLMMDNEELLVLNSPSVEKPTEEPTNSDSACLEGSLLNNMIESEFSEMNHDVPFIGFDKHMTPVLPRRSGQKTFGDPLKQKEESIFETDYLADQRLPEAPKPPTLNELTSNQLMTLESLDVLLPSISSSQSSLSPVSIPDDLSLNSSSVSLQRRPPLIILDNEGIRVLLYWCKVEEEKPKMLQYVVSIQNYSTDTLNDVKLVFKTSDKNALVRLQSSKRKLNGFNLSESQDSLNLIMCVHPLSEVKEVDIDFCLTFIRILEQSISGNFLLSLH